MVDKISIARKKELEQPDPFLEMLHRGMAYATRYKKRLTLLACLVLAVILIVSGTLYSIQSSEKKASMLLTEALGAYKGQDPAARYGAVKDDFVGILNDYPNTAAGRLARVRFAAICFKASQFDQAYELYLTALDDFKGDAAMENLFLAALGHICQAREKPEEARNYFKKIADGSSPLLKDEALFNLGMILADEGNKEESLKLFQLIVSDYSDSLYRPMAEERVSNN